MNMIVFTPIFESDLKEKPSIPKYDGIQMSLDEFLTSEFEDPGFKYEWNNGLREAEEKLKFSEQRIVLILQRTFNKTSAYQKGDGLPVEVECYLPKVQSVRKPDLCYLSSFQIQNCEDKAVNQVPSFIIEIISKTNTAFEVEKKNKEYFDAGVKVVWNIFPEQKMVKVYTSIKSVQICTDNDICNAGDVIPDFQIRVNEIFK